MDSCIYDSRRNYGEMAVILSWVDKYTILGPTHVVAEEGQKITNLIDGDDIGLLNRFVRCKIEINPKNKTAKSTQ